MKTEIMQQIKSARKEQKLQRTLNKKMKTNCSRCPAEITNDNNTSLCDACNEYYGTEN